MKGDVKAVRVSGTGAVFAGRTRLRGMILASDGSGAGSITLQDNTSSGILFEGGMKVSAIANLVGATLLIDK